MEHTHGHFNTDVVKGNIAIGGKCAYSQQLTLKSEGDKTTIRSDCIIKKKNEN